MGPGAFACQFDFTRRGIIERGVNSLEILAAGDAALGNKQEKILYLT